MNAEVLVKENNKKRKELTEENQKIYGDMLIYIRTSFSKSEQETEEILMEILDHLLEAQEAGKTAADVFGNDPKQFAHDIVGELPQMVTKKKIATAIKWMIYLFATLAIFQVVSQIILFFTGLDDLTKTYHLGSWIVLLSINVVIFFILLYSVFSYLRFTCFKRVKKLVEFLYAFLFGAIIFGVFLALYYFIPEFGPTIDVPIYMVFLLGVVLSVIGRIIGKLNK
ncbi:DUF1129 family protein [Evansella halocellulosilytica]|uniref:DUF1129 family protein n=1 Tax=Evansella halocellulosilytica TaxID=2011013 RepID=UPI000BB8F2CC|nr:DUF1129 family protein [Evansella halocellulosilytica]